MVWVVRHENRREIITCLDVRWRVEYLAILPPLNLYGHVPGGDGAGDLASVPLLQISIKGEGRYLRRLDGLEQDVAGGAFSLIVGGGAGVLLTVLFLYILEGHVLEFGRSWILI